MADTDTTAAAPEAPPQAGTDGASTLPSAGRSDWRAALPPDLQVDKTLERFEDVPSLARSYLEARRTISGSVEPPPPDAKPEQLSAYRKRLGLPESPDKYELSLPQPAEGTDFVWDPKWVGILKERAHAVHMNPKQLKAMADLYHEYMHAARDVVRGRQAQDEQAEREEAMKLLEQRWGPRDGPQWRHRNARAVAVLEHVMGDDAPAERQAIIEMAANPYFADGLSRLADGLLERGFISGTEVGTVDVGAAQAKIDALRAASEKDPMHPLRNKMHPDHQRTFDEWIRLHGTVMGPGAWKPIPGMTRG
jgi:hypothetical protein